MSLIQDALKRQQEESENIRVPLKSVAAPSVPETMPLPPNPQPANQSLPSTPPQVTTGSPAMAGSPVDPAKPMQSGKSWKLIAGIIIFCVLIAWSGGLLVVLVLKQSAERTLHGAVMPDLIHGRGTLGKLPVQAPPPAARPPATAMSKPVVTPAPARASASKPLFSPAAAAAPAFADEGEDLEQDMAEPGAVPGTANRPLPANQPQRNLSAIFNNGGADQESARLKPVVWPRLKLSAIFSNMGSGQSGARLNNRLIILGDQIDGVTLIEIRRDSVVLKCGKETRLLKMGATLN